MGTIVVEDLDGGIISDNQTICIGVIPDSILNVTSASGGNGVFIYQWQSSTDNINFFNIAGENSLSYASGVASTQTEYYRRRVSSGACPVKYSNTLTITANTCNGPGGVASDITLWLRADTGIVDDGSVAIWQDQSGNNKHATRTLGSPTKSSNNMNYHPTIIFDGSSGFDTDSIEIEHIFVVMKPNPNISNEDNFQLIGRKNHSSSNHARILGFKNKSILSSSDSSNFSSSDRIRINGKINSTTTSNINILSIDAENKGGVRDVYKLGQKSSGTSYNNLNGEIAEIICYSSKKTGIELAKIESYLSIKYGTTISNINGGINGNYYDSNGNIIWNATDNTYHNDIIGIGKNNANKLNQKQSKTTDGKLTIFVDDLKSSNISNSGTIINDNSYIMVGHNNGSLKSDSIIDLESPAEIKHRLAREWKITNTNFDDNFALEIEWDSTGAFDLSHVRLLVDDDGDFSNATIYGPADGLTFRLGSIIVEDVNSSFIPKGSTSYVTLGSVDELTVLPVELLYFKGEQNGTSVDLKWETASEINSDYFEILHSTDGINFKKIGKVNAAGNSSNSKKYILAHYYPTEGVNYYKLKQYDIDGNFYDRKPIFVNFEFTLQTYDFVLYPNPSYNDGAIYLQTNFTGEINFYIFDIEGKVVYQELITVANQSVYTVKNLNLKPAIYNVVINSPKNYFYTKYVKIIMY